MHSRNAKPKGFLSGFKRQNIMSKPFLKWAGGKHKLVPFIRQFIPHTTKRIIEPFAGSASLSMAIDAESYLLNDSNRDLINLFRVLKDHKGGFCPTLTHISRLQIIQNPNITNLENDLINWTQARKRQVCSPI